MESILYDRMGSQSCFGLYRREYWSDVRFPAGRVYEDLACVFKVYHNCTKPVGLLDLPLYVYNIHPDSISHSVTPSKNYDIFLAFQERWEFAAENYPQFAEKCFAKAADTALGTYNYYLKYPAAKLPENKLNDVFAFLQQHKKAISASLFITGKRRMLFGCYYFSRKLYTVVIKLLNRIG